MAEAVTAGELRDLDPGFLMSAIFGMARVLEEIPEAVAIPPERRGEAPTPTDKFAAQVVDLFLLGAGSGTSVGAGRR